MCFVLLAWFAWTRLLARIAKTATDTSSAKYLVNWDWSIFTCLDTNVIIFHTAIFWILVKRNNKRSSGIDGKTSYCLSGNCVILSYVPASVTILWIIWNGDCWFLANFFMVRAPLVQKTTRWNYSKEFGIFSWFCAHDLIHFPCNFRHTKIIKMLMHEKWTEAGTMKNRALELEPHLWKPRAVALEPCSWKEELQSSVIFMTTPPLWNIHTVAVHIYDPEKKFNR